MLTGGSMGGSTGGNIATKVLKPLYSTTCFQKWTASLCVLMKTMNVLKSLQPYFILLLCFWLFSHKWVSTVFHVVWLLLWEEQIAYHEYYVLSFHKIHLCCFQRRIPKLICGKMAAANIPFDDSRLLGNPNAGGYNVVNHNGMNTQVLEFNAGRNPSICNTPLLPRVKSRTANNCASLSGRHTAVHVS